MSDEQHGAAFTIHRGQDTLQLVRQRGSRAPIPLTGQGQCPGPMAGGDEFTDILTRRPDELSGGQAQRTAVGRALIHEPELILADEPTGNLDSKSARDVLELLSKINKTAGTTIIMVTHDPLAASYCDRVLFIKDGEFFNELYKDEQRQTFFQQILNVLSLLGGNVNDLSSARLP